MRHAMTPALDDADRALLAEAPFVVPIGTRNREGAEGARWRRIYRLMCEGRLVCEPRHADGRLVALACRRPEPVQEDEA